MSRKVPEYYENCDCCGAEFQGGNGDVVDTLPCCESVLCGDCRIATMAHPIRECKAMGWPKPKRITQKQWEEL